MNTLFLGNGINQLAGLAPSWNSLLSDVIGETDFVAPESLLMTLGFELFVQRYLELYPDSREYDIKKKISDGLNTRQAEALRTSWPSSMHNRLLRKRPKNIITTNYDYFLELAIDRNYHPGSASTKEKLYSLHRYREVQGIRIYHIHGECSCPNSICLGYEQYTGSAQYIRSALCKSSGKKSGDFHLANVLRGKDEPEENTWYYSFFQQNIDILGFGLDTSELDIWWLLNYRAKIKREYPGLVCNTITYYETEDYSQDPAEFCSPEHQANFLQSKKVYNQKKELLYAFGIKYVPCLGSTYMKRYEYALKAMNL